MLTIDWKERLTRDAEDYLQNKLPRQDYDFEIIFNAYPERINGKIPAEVITYVAGIIISHLGKKHTDYIPFFRYLWSKKGEYGKVAFAAFMVKLVNKKADVYLPLFEEAMATATETELVMILDKVMLPLLKKHPQRYLQKVFNWTKSTKSAVEKQSFALLIKIAKRNVELIPEIISYFQHSWAYPLNEKMALHVNLLKMVAKVQPEYYLGIWKEYGIYRDPQIVELLCASVIDYSPEIEPVLETWVKSGNARVKKASNAAYKLIMKKKGA